MIFDLFNGSYLFQRTKRATEIVLPRHQSILPVRRVERRLAPQSKIIHTRGAVPQQQLPVRFLIIMDVH